MQIACGTGWKSSDSNENKTENWVEVLTDSDDSQVSIKVVDSGKGIPGDLADKIFTEKFTTKSSDKGTGLGLNICRTILHEHGGTIMLDKQAEHTTFVIKLPLA